MVHGATDSPISHPSCKERAKRNMAGLSQMLSRDGQWWKLQTLQRKRSAASLTAEHGPSQRFLADWGDTFPKSSVYTIPEKIIGTDHNQMCPQFCMWQSAGQGFD